MRHVLLNLCLLFLQDLGGGGAIYAFASNITHNAPAAYSNNRAGEALKVILQEQLVT
jgi:hypothetical protein